MPERRLHVLAVASHPVQYSVPTFRLMAQHPRLDFQVAYCTLRGAEAAYDPEFGHTVKWDVPLLDSYPWTLLPNQGSGSESFGGLCNPGLWKFIRRGRFDAVLCFISYLRATFWISCFAAKSSRTAFLFGTDATTLVSRENRKWKQLAKGFAWPRLFRLADQVLVPSSGTRDLILSLGIPNHRVTLTPYVVDNDWWATQSAAVNREAVRNSWGAGAAATVVLFCAKLQPWKRPLDLLRAFAKANLPNAILVFAGEGPLRPQLESEVAALGITPRVRFLGFVNQSQLPAIYTAADVMVLPSEYEPFAVVVNEAMLCGCPVIASNHVGAARDLVTPVCPEAVYTCGDIDTLAALLSRITAHPALLQHLRQSSLAHMKTWTPQRNVAATVDAIDCAVSHARRQKSNMDKLSVKAAKSSVSSPERS